MTQTTYQPQQYDRVKICDRSHEHHDKVFYVDSIFPGGNVTIWHPALGAKRKLTVNLSQITLEARHADLSV
ncbi:hypothetical protein IQ249_24675 [Lusitaniella coriacea LEGE 07157]|uniref:Uncharacterized protein n=1 Tax=Lusitaniella coriacea LEGE 07157 TaxID=945747 RepID=A0A8J7JFW1_9CYAN|nr:hypothetical protein [Lusitaniella coriacea]MBE9119055.1 hypothetical protein [Lusitaniella coriacea LEGE 07157]